MSLHQDSFYPFEGHLEDIDDGDAKGTTVNIPLPAGTGGDVYRRAWSDVVLPVLGQFEADWVFVSAGYDAHRDDPLGEMSLTAPDYGYMASKLGDVFPVNRTVVALEGGYDLTALHDASAATLHGLNGSYEEVEPEVVSPPEAPESLETAMRVVSRHWSL